MLNIIFIKTAGKTKNGNPKIKFIPEFIKDNINLMEIFNSVSDYFSQGNITTYFWQILGNRTNNIDSLAQEFCDEVNKLHFKLIPQKYRQLILDKYYSDLMALFHLVESNEEIFNLVDINKLKEGVELKIKLGIKQKIVDNDSLEYKYIQLENLNSEINFMNEQSSELYDTGEYIEKLKKDPYSLIDTESNASEENEREMQLELLKWCDTEENYIIDLLEKIRKDCLYNIFFITSVIQIKSGELVSLVSEVNYEENQFLIGYSPLDVDLMYGLSGYFTNNKKAIASLTIRAIDEEFEMNSKNENSVKNYLYAFSFAEGILTGLNESQVKESQEVNYITGKKIPKDPHTTYKNSQSIAASYIANKLLTNVSNNSKYLQ